METKHLFIEAQRLFRKQKHGMDVVALELLQRLRKEAARFNITVVVKADEDICLQAAPKFSIDVLKAAFYPLWEQWILPRHVAKTNNAFLHCTGNTAPLWGKTPLLVTIHDLIFLEENYLLKKDGGSWYQRFGNVYRSLVVPRVAERAKYIITVSEFQRELIMKRLNVAPEKISVVYNGADERFFVLHQPSNIAQTIQKYGINGFPYIFFLANTEPRKNTDGVLKAFAIFCKQYPQYNHKLVIKGLSVEQLQKKIMECGAAAYADRIHRVGYIDYEDLPMLYQGASMLWFPSFSEGFGLPIVEAMAGGTPVITSNCSVMPEIAGDAALLIDPKNHEALAGQAVEILTNDLLRKQLVEKGIRRAGQFTWASSITSLLRVYEKCLH
ncbi:MAG: glycosyltransferase family 4 protein [Ferruginibacter sp.]